MASYLCVKMNSSATKSYNIKSSANKPYLRVDTGFIPLTTATATGPKLMVRAGGVNYRLADFITTTTAITTGTSYLTSSKTTSTSYVTDSRASTSSTGYQTRSSTSSTGYLTRSSTSATGYLTRSSTSATGYKTRASTYSTTYTWRSSTSGTSYITGYSTYSRTFSSYPSEMTWLLTNTQAVFNGFLQHTSKMISTNPYSVTYTSRSTNYKTVTATATCGLFFTLKDTRVKRVAVGAYSTSYNWNKRATVTYQYSIMGLELNYSRYSYGTFGVSNRNTLVLYLDSITSSNTYHNNAQASATLYMPSDSVTLDFQYAFPNISNLYWVTTSTTGNDGRTFDYTTISSFNWDLASGGVGGIRLSRYGQVNSFSLIASSFTNYYGGVRWSEYKSEIRTTATSYLTRKSTSSTGYLTRSSTSTTTYGTRASTSSTTYGTRASTSSTTYATRSSTSNTTYATRSSQYTSNTSYLTQSETYETSYITASTETTMEG